MSDTLSHELPTFPMIRRRDTGSTQLVGTHTGSLEPEHQSSHMWPQDGSGHAVMWRLASARQSIALARAGNAQLAAKRAHERDIMHADVLLWFFDDDESIGRAHHPCGVSIALEDRSDRRIPVLAAAYKEAEQTMFPPFPSSSPTPLTRRSCQLSHSHISQGRLQAQASSHPHTFHHISRLST